MFTGEREVPDRKSDEDEKKSAEKEKPEGDAPPHKFDDWASI